MRPISYLCSEGGDRLPENILQLQSWLCPSWPHSAAAHTPALQELALQGGDPVSHMGCLGLSPGGSWVRELEAACPAHMPSVTGRTLAIRGSDWAFRQVLLTQPCSTKPQSLTWDYLRGQGSRDIGVAFMGVRRQRGGVGWGRTLQRQSSFLDLVNCLCTPNLAGSAWSSQ